MNRVNSKRGFTVVELVVALAVILIVSATAIGLINTQNAIYLRTVQTVEATNMAENAIECFRWADNVGEFVIAYNQTLGDDTLTPDNDGNNTYTIEKYDMTVTITIEVASDNSLKSLKFEAKDDGKEILKADYPSS